MIMIAKAQGALKLNTEMPIVQGSGPLDYSSSRKVKYVEGSTSGSSGLSHFQGLLSQGLDR